MSSLISEEQDQPCTLFSRKLLEIFFPLSFFLTLCVRTWLLELAKCFGLTQNQAVKRREQHQCDAITYLRVTSGCVLKQRTKPHRLDLVAAAAMSDGDTSGTKRELWIRNTF